MTYEIPGQRGWRKREDGRVRGADRCRKGATHEGVRTLVRAPAECPQAAVEGGAGAGFSTDSAGRGAERSPAAGPDFGKARR
ncbi:hypothetical protein GCM10012286_19310 [Streptomyces lasiicapitis]|uniref:Uncharacterized protein n=1 Tax=Streptomyces lasiicapitis TaxID=1923961 RepID=A0ABQ2LNC5_9ACTN|nr:hypothetical protein GCM10012286_19310 [Streptomyces lasiicapitis]